MTTNIFNTTTTPRIVALAVALGALSISYAAYGPSPAETFFSPKKQEAMATKRDILEEKHQQIEFEAFSAVTGTQNALMALKKNDGKLASALLNGAINQLKMVFNKYPDSNIVPAIIDAEIYDFEGDSKEVEKLKDEADDLIKNDQVQDARQMLDQLVSEVHITTVSVPIGSFSMGVKDAADIVNSGNVEKAEDVLQEALNRLIKSTEIMVLPVYKAQETLKEASKIEHDPKVNKADSKLEVLGLLDAAKEKLKLAALLGYGAKDDYSSINDTIDEMKDLIFTEKSTVGWNKVITTLSALEEKLTRLK